MLSGDENISVLSPADTLIPPHLGANYIEQTIIGNLIAMSDSFELVHGTLV
jgi:hypothetical protein